MFDTLNDFARSAIPYLELSDRFIERHQLGGRVVVDHICYKCDSASTYESMRTMLESDPPSRYFYQVHLASRRVAYVGLREGLLARHGPVMCIELADKKPVHEDQLGFHHIEIYPVTMPYQDLVDELARRGETISLKSRPHHTTHDIMLPEGFMIRLTDRPLIKQIIETELSQ